MEKFPDNRTMPSSAWIYPLFVGFATFGLMILFDLSTCSYLSLRYIFSIISKICFGVLCLLAWLARLAVWLVGALKPSCNNLLHSSWGNVKSAMTKTRVWLLAFGGLFGLGSVIHSDSAKVAELSKIWLMVFLGVFLAINQRGWLIICFSAPKMTLLLAFAVVLPFIALGIANEKGTMLVFCFVYLFGGRGAIQTKFSKWADGVIFWACCRVPRFCFCWWWHYEFKRIWCAYCERVNAWVNPFCGEQRSDGDFALVSR